MENMSENYKLTIMKELSIQEKAKCYDEALSLMQDCIPDEDGLVHVKPEEIFPELKESEDERMMNQLHSWMKEFGGAEEYTEKVYQWIKGLLEKQGEHKPAWSEENERTYKSIIYSFAHNYPLTVQQQEFVKSIRPQNTWKPSDEQIEALKGVQEGVFRLGILESLYNDLKKLREE